MKFSGKLKKEILKAIIAQENPFGNYSDEMGLIGFLERIWDLHSMPSEDSRYSDAYGDAIQHLVNNSDWDYEYLFETRFSVLENDDVFQKFIETILHPEVRENEDEIMKFVLLITPYLERENYGLYIIDYVVDDLPVYGIKERSSLEDLPADIKENTIPFYTILNPTGRSSWSSSHQPPPHFPSFVLVFNDGWNDFGIRTEFNLFYYSTAVDVTAIGEVKICNFDNPIVTQVIPASFKMLDGTFCSMGQDFSFYRDLKSLTGRNFESILWALKDAAFFPEIQDKFEKISVFSNSLIRYNDQEQLLREARYRIYDYDLSNLYSFKYTFTPKFSDQSVDIDFNFNTTGYMPDRIYAIIGKNGTGKTQLMTSLPNDIYKKADNHFLPRAPLFSKVISVSYSAFDTFDIPRKTATFNYLYCGLKDEKGERITDRGLLLRFHNTWKQIKRAERMDQWIKILSNFLDQEIVDLFITRTDQEWTVSLDGFAQARKMLSSGQSILLYIITEIVAHIRFDSIILYDEPETHLHPNAISQLMNTIYELVNEFQSYCIIATHSPLVIRELLSKNVFVIEKEGQTVAVRKIGMETFGENLTVLTDEVFGNRTIPKQYKMILDRLVNSGLRFEEILNTLESDGLPLSLNAQMFIKSLLNEKSNGLQPLGN